MKTKFRHIACLLVLSSTVIFSCSKLEHSARKFMRPGTWKIEQITAGYLEFTALPKWQIADCEDFESYCSATWIHSNGSTCPFYWKFNNVGGRFDFFSGTVTDPEVNKAWQQCSNLSGEYRVEENKRGKKFSIFSETTSGYNGTEVTIKMVKN